MGDENTQHISFGANIIVWAALMVLTAVTVAVAYADLGFLHVAAALGIATLKAGLVITYFMHMRHASRTVRAMLFTACLILAIAIGFTFFDVAYR